MIPWRADNAFFGHPAPQPLIQVTQTVIVRSRNGYSQSAVLITSRVGFARNSGITVDIGKADGGGNESPACFIQYPVIVERSAAAEASEFSVISLSISAFIVPLREHYSGENKKRKQEDFHFKRGFGMIR